MSNQGTDQSGGRDEPAGAKVVVAPAPSDVPEITKLPQPKGGLALPLAIGVVLSVVLGFLAWSATRALLERDGRTSATVSGGAANGELSSSGSDEGSNTLALTDEVGADTTASTAPDRTTTSTAQPATTTTVPTTTTTTDLVTPTDGTSLAVIVVTLDTVDGAVVPGIMVELTPTEGGKTSSAMTTGDGRVVIPLDPGCYTATLSARPGYRVPADPAPPQVCVEPNQAETATAVVALTNAEPPSGCRVEPRGASTRGVDIFEAEGEWADTYLFYNGEQFVVFRTSDQAPDENDTTRRQWYGRQGDVFFVGSVESVTAIRNGEESLPVLCRN
jgi:hypothetical protein